MRFALRRGLGILLSAGSCTAAASVAYSRHEPPHPQSSTHANLHIEPQRDAYKYVISGGGTAAQAAADVLVEGDPKASILIVAPWWLGSDSILEHAEVASGSYVRALDVSAKTVTLNTGRRIAYDRALLSIGGETPTPPLGTVLSAGARHLVGGVRSAIDRAHILRLLASTPGRRPHVTLAGGSWLALAAGAELVHGGADVTFVYAEAGFLARHVPKYVSAELRRRLRWVSDGGADFLAYAAIRHIVPRGGEAEVYAGVVFDRLAMVQFHTDRVLLAPTTPDAPKLRAPGLERRGGGFAVSKELAAASDVYAAGACALAPGMEALAWSERFAAKSGVHAAKNMLGERTAFEVPREESLTIPSMRLGLRMAGKVDGGLESLGYFACAREGGEDTCGGSLLRGAVFYLESEHVPGGLCSFRAAGALVWDGAFEGGEMGDLDEILYGILDAPARERSVLEQDLDQFAKEHLGVEPDAEMRGPEVGRVLWRRHVAARKTAMREEELLWLDDGVAGIGEVVVSAEEKKKKAYSDLLRKSVGL